MCVCVCVCIYAFMYVCVYAQAGSPSALVPTLSPPRPPLLARPLCCWCLYHSCDHCAWRVGQPTQRAPNYTARSNIEPAQKCPHANGQSAPQPSGDCHGS